MNVRADRFPLFDSLRAIAALSVLLFHASYSAGLDIFDAPLFRQFTLRLDVGVTIFFVISGFLLYRPFVRARLDGQPMPRILAYLWRRVLRIVPAYWVALAIITVWLGLEGVFTADGFWRFFGFAQIYDSATALGGIGQAWTLCVEISFYAALPLWAVAMRAIPTGGDRRRALVVEIAGLLVLFAIGSLYKVWALGQIAPTDLSSGPYLMPLPNFLDQFAVGMALAVLTVWYQGRDDLPGPIELFRRMPTIGWVIALVAFVIAAVGIGYNGQPFQQYSRTTFVLRHELYTVVALGMVLPAIFAEPGRGLAGRILASRVLTYLGLISYGIYLWHHAVIDQIVDWVGDDLPVSIPVRLLVYVPLALAGSVAIASLSYYLLERPLLSLKRLVPARTPAARGEAIEEPAPATPAGSR